MIEHFLSHSSSLFICGFLYFLMTEKVNILNAGEDNCVTKVLTRVVDLYVIIKLHTVIFVINNKR